MRRVPVPELVIKLVVVLVVGGLSLAAPPSSAGAAPPAAPGGHPARDVPVEGDAVTAARVLTDGSGAQSVNTSRATYDPATDTGGRDCMGGNSVWLRYSPTADGPFRVVVLESDFDEMLAVYSGSPSRLTPLACRPGTGRGAAQVEGRAGTTYFVALSTCCGTDVTSGGIALVQLYAPRPLSFTLPFDTAAAGAASGRAIFTGTVQCSNPGHVFTLATVSQRVGGHVARGTSSAYALCLRSPRPYTLAVDSTTGFAFRPGPASVSISKDASDEFATRSKQVPERVRVLQAAP